MKKHGNYSTVKNDTELKECLGDYYTVEYANKLIAKAKKHGKNNKRHKEKNKERGAKIKKKRKN